MFPSIFACSLTAKALALVVVVSTLALIPVTPVSANGPHVRSIPVFNGPAGPYQVRVEVMPLVENFHITVVVSQLQGGGPVTGARVQVVGTGPGSDAEQVGPVTSTTDFLSSPNAYTATLSPRQAGRWVFTVTVNSADGEATVDVPVVLQQPGEANWLAPTVAALLFVLLWQVTQVAARFWMRRNKASAPP